MIRNNAWLVAAALVLAMIVPQTAYAFDYLEITVVNPQIVQGRPAVTVEVAYSVRVRAVNANGTTDTTADFINAELYSPDVPATLPSSAYLQAGERQFDNLVMLADGQPVRLRVRDADDGSVPFGEILIDCYNFVDRFNVVVPGGDKFVDQAINITLQALDQNGDLVLNFRDDVTLDALVGDFASGPTTNVAGTSFTLGAVTVPVTFWGTDPATRENELTATNAITYPGQGLPASGQATVTPLRPGPLNTVMLLLPGETLTPGVSPGKTGTPNAQISGIAFPGVDVYATDLHWNPVEPPTYPTLTWSTDDPSGGVSLPAGGGMSGNAELDESVTLISSGLRRVTATASGAISSSSDSFVQLNPEGLDHFVFDYAVWDTTDVQVTTIPFQLRVRAEDINNNPFPFNGQVTIRALLGTSDESEDYVIVNNSTFVNGQLDALVQVTKRAFSARVIVDSNGAVVGTSGRFQVNSGPLDRIMTTWPGETWVPGLNDDTFSGNIGNPNSTVAGAEVFPVTVRPVDRYGNIVSGQRNVTVSSGTGYFELPDYPNNLISLNNPVDVRVILRTYQTQTLTCDASGVGPEPSSGVFVSPAPYGRMVVEAPGETLDPGIFDTLEDDGKIGNPSVQDAGVPFDVRVYAVDSYWNPITDLDPALPISTNFDSSDPAAVLPSSPQSLTDNSVDFTVTLITLADPNQQTVEVDDPANGVSAFVPIPLKAGIIDHFDIGVNNSSNPTPNDVLLDIPDHQAGSSLPNVTIVARDVFNNHIADYTNDVTLFVDHGTNVLTPQTVSMGDGFGSGTYQGVWRGPIQITKAGVDVRLFAREELFATTDSSNAFTVFAGPYGDLVLLLPGESHTPGIAPGKVGTPLPTIAGDPVVATVLATDAYWNPVTSQPAVHLASSDYFQMISANDQPLDPDGTATFDLLFRAATLQTLSVSDLITPANADESDILVSPDEFARLMILLPGETAQPGGPEADGKTGTPTTQIASIDFDVRMHSVDQFWNRVDNSTEHIHLATDDASVTPTNPVNNDQQLVNGEIIMPMFLTTTGFVTLSTSALDDLAIVGQSVTVEVEQGSLYQITTPATAAVGPPAAFSMTIALLDSLGSPVPEANNFVDIKAFRSNLQPASSTLQVTQAQLNAGTVTITNQAYDTVEEIVLQITDASGRASYSNPIIMTANGLEYVVTVGTDPPPRVGPPATFPVSVVLRDTDTQTIIDDDRDFTVEVYNSLGGLGAGVWAVTNQRLDRGTITFQQSYTRAENIYIRISDSTGLEGFSPVFAVAHDGYKRLQIVAPGEVVEPGVAAFDAEGKSGTPDRHRSGEPFPITVRAVDQYWNLASDIDTGDLRLVASDNSFSLPGNPNVNNVPFVNGRRTFTGFLTDQGTVDVTVYDEADLAKPEQTVGVPIDPPYEYQITVPATASTGPVPGFQVVVTLIDPTTGNVVPSAQNRVYLTALQTNLALASGTLGVPETQLIDGAAVVNNQSYSTVEDIILRVSDDFGREAFSTVIQMDTGGLFFSVSIPDSATVGPPVSFPLTVELLDSNTGERVTTQDRLVDIEVFSASSGLAGTGALGVRQGLLEQGLLTISQTYSKAEDIFLQVNDDTGVTGISNTCRVLADGFKRLQIVAPGEMPEAGALSGTGKSGVVLTQQAEVPFSVQIRAVDQYWNMVNTISDGVIRLTSSGNTLLLEDPVDEGAPFVNGARDFRIILGDPGVVAVFATDESRPSVSTGRVDIPVNEAEYRVILPDPAVVTAGPPSTFAVTVRLVNPETEERINAGNDFNMRALLPDRTAASNTLGIDTGTLVAGEAQVTGQNYATSETIVIEVTDSRGRVAYSDELVVAPVGVTWSVAVPDTVYAGQPWSMDVQRIDIVTGQIVTSDDRNFTLTAFSGNAPRPDIALDPNGVLCTTSGTTSGGTVTLAGQCYDRAEAIFLELTDSFDEGTFSTVIQVLPDVAAELNLFVEELPGQPLNRPLRPGELAFVAARLTDASGNPIPSGTVTMQVTSGDGRLGSAQATAVDVATDGNGRADADLRILDTAGDDILLNAYVGGILSNTVLVEVLGPPRTTISFAPEASPYGEDGFYLSSSTLIQLQATTGDPGGIQAIFVDVDVSDPPLPQQVYTGPFSLDDLGRGAPGVHTIRFFAEEVSGVIEEVQTVRLYTSTALSTDRPITNRPNPFRAGQESTVVLFQAPTSGTVTATIYDLFGGTVFSRQLRVDGGTTAQFVWDGVNGQGSTVANGGYILRVQGPGIDLRRKIGVLK